MEHTALIVGAGPTGLTCAAELKRFAIPFRIIDKAEHGARYSQALGVQARTLEQLERYHLADTAVQKGRPLKQASFISEGKTIATIPLEGIPSRYPYVLFLPQKETEQILSNHLHQNGIAIERGVELAELQQNQDQVHVTLRRSEGSLENTSVRWLFGCDGAHSTTREKLNIPFAGSKVDLHFLLGDLEVEGPDKLGDELRLYLHHGDVVFIGRLTDKVYRVIVALHSHQTDEPTEPQITVADFQAPMDRMGIRLKVLSSEWMTPFHVNDRQAEHIRSNRAFLAGDASHIHSPVGGQGMNTGMQDVANLAWKIAAVENGADPGILDSYEEERGAVGKALLERTSRGLAAVTTTNPLLEKVRDAVMSIASKMPAVQESVLSFVSETDIHYRHSSIVVDCGGSGSLKAGDRVPDPDILWNDGRGQPLLAQFDDSKHLAIALDADEALLRRQVPKASLLSLQTTELKPETGRELAALIGKQGLIVIRPDGYVGFRGTQKDEDKLESYVQRMALT